MSETFEILIADDHDMVRRGLRALLSGQKGWHVCGEAADGREAVEKARALNPDVVIMDVTMPGLNGLEATRLIRKEMPRCEVLILTMHHSEQLVQEVLAAGARSYILKSDAGDLVVTALEHLRRGKPFFTSHVSEVLLSAYLDSEASSSDAPEAGGLTVREREIIQLIAEGKSGKDIATLLGISGKTVETHRANLMRKLQVHSVSEIVRFAIRNRMIEP